MEPDPVTYAILLNHFSRAADWDKVDSLLEEMHSKGMSARTPIYAGYIRHLCRTFQWNRALSLYLVMKELGAEVTPAIYLELLQVGQPLPCMFWCRLYICTAIACHESFEVSMQDFRAVACMCVRTWGQR